MAEQLFDPPITGGVVCGHDGSDAADRALTAAAEQARFRGCALHLLRGWRITEAPRPPDVPHGIVPSVAQFAAEVRRRLQSAVDDTLGAEPDVEVVLHAPHASATDALLAAAETADLLVVGSRGLGGFTGLLLGSTSEQVIRHAHCPVLVVRAT